MLLCMFLLYCLLQGTAGCTVKQGQTAAITKSVGDSVVLFCSCTNLQDNPNTVQWGYRKQFIQSRYEADYSVFPENSSQNQRYKNRVQRLNQSPPGDLSLVISNLTEEDEGTYLCGISGGYSRAITLYVRGCAVLGFTERLITRSPGESVLLPCPCPNDGRKISPQSVTWKFSDTSTVVSNQTQSYSGRVWTFDQIKSRNFSLLISDLTKEDSGDYECEKDIHTPFVSLQVKGCSLAENKQTVLISKDLGESVYLSCACTDLMDEPVRVQWRTPPNYEDIFSTNVFQLYSGRVQNFTTISPGNLSVLISNLTEEDGGTYSCWINKNQYKNFNLSVKGCRLSESGPKTVTGYSGKSVLLPCSCTDQSTKPLSVKWERVDSVNTEISSEKIPYRDRVQTFNMNLPANLSLLISNLTEQDQGMYRCTINNKQSININLSIKGGTNIITPPSACETPFNFKMYQKAYYLLLFYSLLLILIF